MISLGINEDYVVFEVTSPSSNKLVDLKGTKDDGPKGSLHKTMNFAIDVFNEVCTYQIYCCIDKSDKALLYLYSDKFRPYFSLGDCWRESVWLYCLLRSRTGFPD